MARISKYLSAYTEKSEALAKEFSKSGVSINLEEVEALQMKYGISNVLLSDTLKISLGVLSKWKNGERDLPEYYKINIHCFFKYLEEHYKSEK
jgi:DNA-binding transcriptional regulator YiaG